MLRAHRLELVADFQQFYGLDLLSIAARRAAGLAVMLPSDSRTMKAIDPAAGWSRTDHLLSLIELWTHVMVWRETKDAKSKRNVPVQITPSVEQNKRETSFSAPVDEYAALLAKPRKEVPFDGNGTRVGVSDTDTLA